MSKTSNTKIAQLYQNVDPNTGFPQIGRVAGIGEDGEVLVRIGAGEAHPARLVAGLNSSDLRGPDCRDREVLLVFENGDRSRPIVVALMQTPLEERVELSLAKPKTSIDAISVDGERLVIEANEEVVLKCGKASITLRKDGKVVVKGTNLLSRSTGSNRIKGGSVNIN